MEAKTLLVIFLICSVLAIGASAYLLKLDFSSDENAFCNLSESFNCVKVSQTDYAWLLGIPVALWGLIFYVGTTVVSTGLLLKWNFRRIHNSLTRKRTTFLLFIASIAGLLFALYLTFVEAFIIHAFCIFCLAQQLLILVMYFSMLYLVTSHKKV